MIPVWWLTCWWSGCQWCRCRDTWWSETWPADWQACCRSAQSGLRSPPCPPGTVTDSFVRGCFEMQDGWVCGRDLAGMSGHPDCVALQSLYFGHFLWNIFSVTTKGWSSDQQSCWQWLGRVPGAMLDTTRSQQWIAQTENEWMTRTFQTWILLDDFNLHLWQGVDCSDLIRHSVSSLKVSLKAELEPAVLLAKLVSELLRVFMLDSKVRSMVSRRCNNGETEQTVVV